MNKIHIYLTLIVASLLCSCADESKSETQTVDLIGKVYDCEIIPSPSRVISIGDILITSSSRSESIFGIYRLGEGLTMTRVGKYGYIGRGPGEFISPLVTSTSGDTIFINDFQKKEVVALKLEDMGSAMSEVQRLSYTPTKVGRTRLPNYYMTAMQSGGYIAISMADHDKIFSLFDNEFKHLQHFGVLPFADGANANSLLNNMGGFMRVSGEYMVYALSKLPYFALYKRDAGTVKELFSKEIRPIYVEVINESIKFEKERSWGMCAGCELGQDHIYILFNDTSLESRYNATREAKDYPNMVLIYDYNGELQKSFRLDHHISSFTINDDETKIYGYSVDRERVVEYDI